MKDLVSFSDSSFFYVLVKNLFSTLLLFGVINNSNIYMKKLPDSLKDMFLNNQMLGY